MAGPVALPGRRRSPFSRRLWDLPLRAHVAALGLILLALVPLVGTSSSFLSDEGAAVIQARSLASGKGWLVEHPLPQVDPDGRHYPLVSSERGPRGFAPLGKHPAYALLLAGATRLGGVTAMVLLSVVGTLIAAALAGALAARLDPVLARPTIWVVGLASPLVFDAFVVMGHTLGAACAAGAVLCAVVAVTERRRGMALGVAPCIAVAVLLRSEALLFAGALAVGVAVIGLRGRPRAPALLAAGAALAAAVVAGAGQAAWIASIVGDRPVSAAMPAPVGADGFLQGRVDGFVMTWLLPDYRASRSVSLFLLAMVTALVAAALGARSAPLNRPRVLVPAGLAAAAATAALISGPTTVVPGLLVAFPVIAAGAVLLRRVLFRDAVAALPLVTSGIFALAVIATQYPTGGTGEWGGRYFALAIPVVVPVLLLALRRQSWALDRLTRRGVLAAVLVCSLALTLMAVLSLRASHRSWAGFTRSVERAQEVAGTGSPVVTTWSAAPRFAWAIFDRRPWLLSTPEDLQVLRESLAGVACERFVFVTVNLEADRPRMAGLDVIWADGPLDGGRRIMVVTEAGDPPRPTTLPSGRRMCSTA